MFFFWRYIYVLVVVYIIYQCRVANTKTLTHSLLYCSAFYLLALTEYPGMLVWSYFPKVSLLLKYWSIEHVLIVIVHGTTGKTFVKHPHESKILTAATFW